MLHQVRLPVLPDNLLLLWMQAEQRGVTLSRVAGYRAWQAMGRQVVKGARSFAVRAPVRRRLTVEEAAERARTGQRPAFDADGRPALVVRGFRLERVFRYEDTEGEPLPEEPGGRLRHRRHPGRRVGRPRRPGRRRTATG